MRTGPRRAMRSRRRTKKTAPRGGDKLAVSVIASEAKQSIEYPGTKLDCFVATFLAVTAQTMYGRNMSASGEPANLADMVRARAKSRGNAIAFEFEGRRTSFAEFDIKTNRVANALKALGVTPRERIAYLGKNSDIYFELLLGAMKANVVMAPVNWRLAGPDIAFILGNCKAPVLFVGPEFVEQIGNIKSQLPGVRTFIATEGGAPGWLDYAAWRDAQSGDDPKVELSPKDVAIQLYTSGTTGKPK